MILSDATWDIIIAVAKALLILVVMIGAGAFMSFIERRLLGLWQDRYGPNRVGPFGLFQAVADVIKLFMKEDVTPLYVDKLLYNLAPWITMMPALVTFAVIPFGAPLDVTIGGVTRNVPLIIADVNIGILYIFAFASLGIYGIVLAGWASNNKYSMMGGLRASAQIISYELSMGFAAASTFLVAGSLRLPLACRIAFAFSLPLACRRADGAGARAGGLARCDGRGDGGPGDGRSRGRRRLRRALRLAHSGCCAACGAHRGGHLPRAAPQGARGLPGVGPRL